MIIETEHGDRLEVADGSTPEQIDEVLRFHASTKQLKISEPSNSNGLMGVVEKFSPFGPTLKATREFFQSPGAGSDTRRGLEISARALAPTGATALAGGLAGQALIPAPGLGFGIGAAGGVAAKSIYDVASPLYNTARSSVPGLGGLPEAPPSSAITDMLFDKLNFARPEGGGEKIGSAILQGMADGGAGAYAVPKVLSSLSNTGSVTNRVAQELAQQPTLQVASAGLGSGGAEIGKGLDPDNPFSPLIGSISGSVLPMLARGSYNSILRPLKNEVYNPTVLALNPETATADFLQRTSGARLPQTISELESGIANMGTLNQGGFQPLSATLTNDPNQNALLRSLSGSNMAQTAAGQNPNQRIFENREAIGRGIDEAMAETGAIPAQTGQQRAQKMLDGTGRMIDSGQQMVFENRGKTPEASIRTNSIIDQNRAEQYPIYKQLENDFKNTHGEKTLETSNLKNFVDEATSLSVKDGFALPEEFSKAASAILKNDTTTVNTLWQQKKDLYKAADQAGNSSAAPLLSNFAKRIDEALSPIPDYPALNANYKAFKDTFDNKKLGFYRRAAINKYNPLDKSEVIALSIQTPEGLKQVLDAARIPSGEWPTKPLKSAPMQGAVRNAFPYESPQSFTTAESTLQDVEQILLNEAALKFAASNKVTAEGLRTWMQDNKSRLDLVPHVREKLRRAANKIGSSAEKGDEALNVLKDNVTKQSGTIVSFAKGGREGAIQTVSKIMDSENPMGEMQQLVDVLKLDKSGRAVGGLRDAFAEDFMRRVRSKTAKIRSGSDINTPVPEDYQVMNVEMERLLAEGPQREALKMVFKPEEIRKIDVARKQLELANKPSQMGVNQSATASNISNSPAIARTMGDIIGRGGPVERLINFALFGLGRANRREFEEGVVDAALNPNKMLESLKRRTPKEWQKNKSPMLKKTAGQAGYQAYRATAEEE
jgi:hypothetical protein